MSVYFLSDLHLGAPYFPDSKDSERRIVSFLDYIKKDAEAIYLLGDIRIIGMNTDMRSRGAS